LAYGLMFTSIQNEKNTGKRLEHIKKADTDRVALKATRDRVAEAAKRRKSVQDSLKDLETKHKARDVTTKKPPLRVQLRQAGMTVSVQRFYIYSVLVGLLIGVVLFVLGVPILVALGAMVAGAFGLPRWFVGFKRARRVKRFLAEFPN